MATDLDASEEVGASVAAPLPRENLVRAVLPGVELRSADDGTRTLTGHFSVFNEWTEIKSAYEGHFLERVAPGAFKKTFLENRNAMKVLFDHGHDPAIGNKPLGKIRNLVEDERGAFYEVDLLETSYNRDLVPALEAGLLGASFRFRVMRDDKDDTPEPSEHNPHGLPERTIREVKVFEFGPVAFPAYSGATAGVRSLTDEHILRSFLEHPERLKQVLSSFLPAVAEEAAGKATAPTDDRAEPVSHPVVVRRDARPLFGLDKKEEKRWLL